MEEVESGVKYMLDFKSPIQGLLGVHSRCGLHTRTVTKSRPLSRGFRHFVTSMPAPVASGWSGCRVGLAPTGKRRLARRTGHATISNCYSMLRPDPCCPYSWQVFLSSEGKGHTFESCRVRRSKRVSCSRSGRNDCPGLGHDSRVRCTV